MMMPKLHTKNARRGIKMLLEHVYSWPSSVQAPKTSRHGLSPVDVSRRRGIARTHIRRIQIAGGAHNLSDIHGGAALVNLPQETKISHLGLQRHGRRKEDGVASSCWLSVARTKQRAGGMKLSLADHHE